MHFDKDILEKVAIDTSLKFWGQEVTAEVMKASQDSAQGSSVLAILGLGVEQDDIQTVTNRLVASGFSDFFSRAPGIKPYFHRHMESIGRYLEEVVTNVNAYEEQIVQELLDGRQPTRVLSMNQASFTYCGARSVLIITTDAGKFLYKPHTMRYRAVFNELCESLLPGKVRVPRVIDCGDACLCEFIQSVPPANNQELSTYYEGLGGYLALAYFLSLTDQHAENILPVGPKFAPIDVETLLLAFPAIKGSSPEPNDPALSIRSSIASTAMLSYGHDRLIGSLITGAKSKSITHINTSTEAIDYLNIIAKGFTEAFRRCLQNKRMICDAINSLSDVDLRILMGPGSFYQGLQSRFFKLEGWDEETRLQDLDNILSSTRFKRTNQAVFEHERAVLIEHDIPYFTVKAGGTDLHAEGKIIWKDYLAKSPVETAICHVKKVDETDLEWQLKLLRKFIGGMPLMSKTRVPDIQPQNEPLTEDNALEEADWILQRLFDEQIDYGRDRHVLMAFNNADGSFSPMDASLGWGYAGVGTFAAICLRLGVGDSRQAQTLVDLSLEGIARNGRYLRMVPEILSTAEAFNIKTGIAGQLRALQLMWSATHDHKVQKTYTDLLTLLEALDFSGISDSSALGALNDLAKVLDYADQELSECSLCESITNKLTRRAVKHKNNDSIPRGTKERLATDNAELHLQNCDDLKGGNAGVVEQLITSSQIESAGRHLAAMVARRHETGNYIHKGAWRVPYFDPTLFHGATGVGYELLRYARPDVVEPLL